MGSTVLEPNAPGYVDPLEAMLKPPSAPFFRWIRTNTAKLYHAKATLTKKLHNEGSSREDSMRIEESGHKDQQTNTICDLQWLLLADLQEYREEQ